MVDRVAKLRAMKELEEITGRSMDKEIKKAFAGYLPDNIEKDLKDEFRNREVRAITALLGAGVLPSDVSYFLNIPLHYIQSVGVRLKDDIKAVAARLGVKYQTERIRQMVDNTVSTLEEQIASGDPQLATNASRELLNLVKSNKLEELLEGRKGDGEFGDIPDDIESLERQLRDLDEYAE